MNNNSEMLLCIWSQLLNDRTAHYVGQTYNKLLNEATLTITCESNVIQITLRGNFQADLDNYNKDIYLSNTKILSILIIG